MAFGEKTINDVGLDECSSALVNLIVRELRDAQGIHAETALSVVGTICGATLSRAMDRYRDTEENVAFDSKLEVEEVWPTVVEYLRRYLREHDIDADSGWRDEIPVEHTPREEVLSRSNMLLVWAQMILDEHQVPMRWQPIASGLAMAKLITMTKHVVPTEIAKAVASASLRKSAAGALQPVDLAA